MKQCPFCGRTYDDPLAEYCDIDGAALRSIGSSPVAAENIQQQGAPSASVSSSLPQVTVKCKKCGWAGPLSEGWCPDCGLKLEETTQVSSQGAIIQGSSSSPSQLPFPVQAVSTGSATMQPFLELIFADSTKLTINQFPRILGRKDILRYPESEFVSGKHVAFYYENTQFSIEDQNSLNGTSLNGQVIGSGRNSMGKKPLKDGDNVQLALNEKGEGAIKFTVRIVNPPK